MRIKALYWERHDYYICEKVVDWCTVIENELVNPFILPDNIYNMDKRGVLLGVLNSVKVLVSKNELRNYRGAGVKRTLTTAIECVSADSRYLYPLVIWPAATCRSYLDRSCDSWIALWPSGNRIYRYGYQFVLNSTYLQPTGQSSSEE